MWLVHAFIRICWCSIANAIIIFLEGGYGYYYMSIEGKEFLHTSLPHPFNINTRPLHNEQWSLRNNRLKFKI